MNANLYKTAGGHVVNLANVRDVAKSGSNLAVTWADGTQTVYSDPSNAVYNAIFATAN